MIKPLVAVWFSIGLFPDLLLAADEPPTIQLAREGKALLPIVVAEDTTVRVRRAADVLAEYLRKITAAPFAVETGSGARGIVVGLPSQFAETVFGDRWAEAKIEEREDYLVQTQTNGVFLLGATELAVEHAVWELLYRIGHRQYFPGEHWEVIPQRESLSVAIHVEHSPDYRGRRIWYGFGPWDYAREPYDRWCARNRATAGMTLHTGHAYGGIIRRNQAEFDQHPEYYALVDGTRNVAPQAKLCIANSMLRRLVVDHAVRHFEENPTDDSISMDPSDGGGWCECPRCKALGSVSDQALTLANEVAEAINAAYDGDSRYVGMYAYNYHSPPPSIHVHPNVVISVATSFIKGGRTLDELIHGWSRQGATLGIREYYSVNTWDRDMPARARGGRIDYLRETIPKFHRQGARFLSAESSDNWGPNGLGYWIAARMMWDVEEAKNSGALIDDFLDRCFAEAKEPMTEFYRQLDGSKPHLVLDDQLGRMFRALDEAKRKTDSPQVHARLDDLVLYAHYVALYDRYDQAKGADRQKAFESLIRHTYRMRRTMLVHAKALYRDLVARDKSVSIPENTRWAVPEEKNVWKSSKPFSASELAAFLSQGIEHHPLVELDFEPIAFSESLVSARGLNLEDGRSGTDARGRGVQTFYVRIDQVPYEIKLRITGGLIAHYRDRGNVRVNLWKLGGASETGEQETLVAEDRSVPPDGIQRLVTLTVKEAGLYKITVADGGDLTTVSWPTGTPISFKSSLAEPIKTNGRWSLYFYVPRGTKVIGLFGGSAGTVHSPDGQTALSFDRAQAGYHSVPVPPGNDGKLWKVHHAAGAIRLLTVPPYLARSGEELLLPKEVVARDAADSKLRRSSG